jgi:hypothetical protein
VLRMLKMLVVMTCSGVVRASHVAGQWVIA